MITKHCDRCGKEDPACTSTELRLEIPGVEQRTERVEVCAECAPVVAATYGEWLDTAFPFTAKVRASKA